MQWRITHKHMDRRGLRMTTQIIHLAAALYNYRHAIRNNLHRDADWYQKQFAYMNM